MRFDQKRSLVSRTFERSSYPIDSFLQVVDFLTDFRSNRINPHRKYDHPNSHLGRETEEKVHGAFMLAGRFGPTAITQVSALKDQVNKEKKGAATQTASEGPRGSNRRP